MLKKTIKYKDFLGEDQERDFYFHISKAELIELEVEYKDGLAAMLKAIVGTEDAKELVAQFKRIILLAYGERSSDGQYFDKSEEMRERFKHHAAYEALFMELSTQDKAAAIFLKGILPDDLGGMIDISDVAKLNEAVRQSPTPPTSS